MEGRASAGAGRLRFFLRDFPLAHPERLFATVVEGVYGQTPLRKVSEMNVLTGVVFREGRIKDRSVVIC